MKAFLTQLTIQFRCDLRDKGSLMVFYMVPFAFYLVMGSIMRSLDMQGDTPLILSISVFALSIAALLGMPQNLVKAREQGILEAYRAAGIPAWSMPLAAIIISTLHILIVSAIILATAPIIFQAEPPASMVDYFAKLLLAALSSQAIGALLSCLVKKQNTMTLVSQCVFLPTIMFSGIMFPANLLPLPMQWIGSVLPATLMVRGDAASTAAMCGITIAAFAASSVMFRRISARK